MVTIALDVPARAQNRVPKFIAPILFTKAQGQTLAGILLNIPRMWGDSVERIMQGYTPQMLDSPAENESVIGDVENRISAVMLTLGASVREWTVRMERWHRNKWIASVYSATNVDLRTILTGQAAEDTIATFVARNVALMKDVSSEAQRRISDSIFRGYQERMPATEVARQIREAVDLGRDRSIRIAGDQLSKLSAALDKERQLEAGFEFGKYRHSGKRHPRPWHKARDGMVFDLKTRKQVNPDGTPMSSGGQTIPADDWPGFPPFCGCRMGAYLPIQAEIEGRP